MMVAESGIEPEVSRLSAERFAIKLHREILVDPAGLKPAPHGLKGRRSVARAPGQNNC